MLSVKQITAAALASSFSGVIAMPTVDAANGVAIPDIGQQDHYLTCFAQGPALDWHTAAAVRLAIDKFCFLDVHRQSIQKGASISNESTQVVGYNLHLEVTNDRCDDPLEGGVDCSHALIDVTETCYQGPKIQDHAMTGGQSQTRCGDAVFQLTAIKDDHVQKELPDTGAIHEMLKRTGNCTSNTSPCRPPNWGSCTAQEKSCLLGSACEFMSCLMAGFCLACS